ncbi:hypothetical protein CROQUDRAFT_701949 [Cronartium quercuum f. sp. fusiforme G11]|uniref:Uncharacterized protein n=1 Tax=Cronartium quercuum f. sp. fusiforme G11 TaxID=708437 RepID=A0A9P6NGV1_9BASI|nr:hypothetical protein CROQUDRAFT_701949 [Cronartium quercuum f. sp. fusiforme G11]
MYQVLPLVTCLVTFWAGSVMVKGGAFDLRKANTLPNIYDMKKGTSPGLSTPLNNTNTNTNTTSQLPNATAQIGAFDMSKAPSLPVVQDIGKGKAPGLTGPLNNININTTPRPTNPTAQIGAFDIRKGTSPGLSTALNNANTNTNTTTNPTVQTGAFDLRKAPSLPVVQDIGKGKLPGTTGPLNNINANTTPQPTNPTVQTGAFDMRKAPSLPVVHDIGKGKPPGLTGPLNNINTNTNTTPQPTNPTAQIGAFDIRKGTAPGLSTSLNTTNTNTTPQPTNPTVHTGTFDLRKALSLPVIHDIGKVKSPGITGPLNNINTNTTPPSTNSTTMTSASDINKPALNPVNLPNDTAILPNDPTKMKSSPTLGGSLTQPIDLGSLLNNQNITSAQKIEIGTSSDLFENEETDSLSLNSTINIDVAITTEYTSTETTLIRRDNTKEITSNPNEGLLSCFGDKKRQNGDTSTGLDVGILLKDQGLLKCEDGSQFLCQEKFQNPICSNGKSLKIPKCSCPKQMTARCNQKSLMSSSTISVEVYEIDEFED